MRGKCCLIGENDFVEIKEYKEGRQEIKTQGGAHSWEIVPFNYMRLKFCRRWGFCNKVEGYVLG